MKINALVLVAFILTGAFQSNAQNILTDGGFSNTTEIGPLANGTPPAKIWYTWINNNLKTSSTVVDGVCINELISPSNYYYEFQLIQYGFSLIPGHSYWYSFRVKADADRLFGVYIGKEGEPWTNIINENMRIQSASKEWRTISIYFNSTNAFEKYKLSFELGAQMGKTYFDDIELIDLGPASIDAAIAACNLKSKNKAGKTQQQESSILGEWFPLDISDTGLGKGLTFMPEGKVSISPGAYLNFIYLIEGDTLVSIIPFMPPVKFKYKIDGTKLVLSGGGRDDQELTRISPDNGGGIIGKWKGLHYTGASQIFDFTSSQNQYLSIPFSSSIEAYQIKGDVIEISDESKDYWQWSVNADTLKLESIDGNIRSKYIKIK
jgi:hypothetical protein